MLAAPAPHASPTAMFHVVLFRTRNPAEHRWRHRLCASTGAELHLIHPLGFVLDDARLRRAGLDYREYARVREHASWPAFLEAVAPERLRLHHPRCPAVPRTGLRTRRCAAVRAGTRGLPQALLESLPAGCRVRLPMRPACAA